MQMVGLKEESDRDCLGPCHGALSQSHLRRCLARLTCVKGPDSGQAWALFSWGALMWLCLSFLVCPVGGALVPTTSVLETALSDAQKGSMAACRSLN